jgi:nucleoside-diphosphate-sugar epimerase
MADLCRAVEAIVTGPDAPGIYNVASFNTTVAAAAAAVSGVIGCPVETMPPSPTYDFTMGVRKLTDVFGVEPRQTVRSLIQDLVAWHNGHDLGSFE